MELKEKTVRHCAKRNNSATAAGKKGEGETARYGKSQLGHVPLSAHPKGASGQPKVRRSQSASRTSSGGGRVATASKDARTAESTSPLLPKATLSKETPAAGRLDAQALQMGEKKRQVQQAVRKWN